MFIDFENEEEFEMFSKWTESNSKDIKFHLKLKNGAPEKYKKLFKDARNRLLKRK